MLGLLIFSIFSILLIYNYRKWVVIFTAIQPALFFFSLWNQSLTVWLTILIILVYPFKFHKIFKGINTFPFTIPLLAVGLSMFATDFFAENMYKHTPTTIISIGSKCILIFIFWRIYRSSPTKTLSCFIKSSFIITAIICLYSLIETITLTNPYISWVIDNNIYIGETKFINEIRYGLKRSQSIFPMHTTLAGFCISVSCFLYIAYKKKYIKNNALSLCTIVLTFLCAFFTGARSGIIGILFCFLFILLHKKVNIKHLIPFFALAIIFFLITEDYLNAIIDSFTDTESTSGSNTDMRKEQFAISLLFFEKAPIWGNGFNFATTVGNQIYPDLYGAESLWFHIMINHGIVGIISYLLVYLYAIIYTIKQKRPILIFYILGFLSIQTLSSVPGIEVTYLFIYLFVTNEILKTKNNYATHINRTHIQC